MSQITAAPSPRRGLSADALIETLRRRFESVTDVRRQASCEYSMADTLMSAFAMFAAKSPSMLGFEDRLRELRIEKPFKIKRVASDTQMRSILDGIDTELSTVNSTLFHGSVLLSEKSDMRRSTVNLSWAIPVSMRMPVDGVLRQHVSTIFTSTILTLNTRSDVG